MTSITWDAAYDWANERGLWRLARIIGSNRLQHEVDIGDSESDDIGSSDISYAAIELIKEWMTSGIDHLERQGVITMGLGGRVAEVNLNMAYDLFENKEQMDMTTSSGGIAGAPSGFGGWAPTPGKSPKRKPITGLRKPSPRRIGASDPSEIVEPAPEPAKRARQLIVGEKEPFSERLERYLASHLSEMEDFQLLNTLASPQGKTEAGIGPKAKEIQQRVGIDNSERSQDAPLPKDKDKEEDE